MMETGASLGNMDLLSIITIHGSCTGERTQYMSDDAMKQC